MATAPEYDAFISYSHQHDRALGPALQTGLERFAKPWYRPRALRIFRDAANLSASPALWASIEEALQSSRWFILLASPDAARSEWVAREVRWWLDHHRADRLLVVGTSPGLAWDERAKDWAAGAPVPPVLRGAFDSEPRWVELTGIPLHRRVPVIPAECLAEVAAPIRGLTKDMLFGDHLRKHRRTMRLAWGAIAFLLALSVGLAAVAAAAIRARQQAISERNLAVSGLLISQSGTLGEADPALSRLASLAAWRINPSSAARYAMLTAAAMPGFATFITGKRSVLKVAFSPSGKIVATVLDNGIAQLWNVTTRQRIGTDLNRLNQPVNDVAFSPDGKILASVGFNGSVRLWEVATRLPVGSLPTGRTSGWMTSVAFSPDGEIVASSGEDGRVSLWDMASRLPVGSILANRISGAISVSFNRDNTILAVGDYDGSVSLWNVATRREVSPPFIQDGSPRAFVAFSPDGKSLASTTGAGTVRLWDPGTGAEFGNPLNASDGPVDSVAFSPDGSILAGAGADGMVWLWDTVTGRQIGAPLNASAGPVRSVAFSPDGKTLASANADGTVRLWDVGRVAGIATLTASRIRRATVDSVAFSPDGKKLAVATVSGTVLWDMAARRQIGEPLTTNLGPVHSVAFSPDGTILATAAANGTVLWNTVTLRPIGKPLTGRLDYVNSVAFSPDGKIFAVGDHGMVRLWDVTSHREVATLTTSKTRGDWVDSVAFSSDGKILAAATAGVTVLWDVASRHQIGSVVSSSDTVIYSMAFSPDGRILAVSSGPVVQLWDVATRRQIGNPFINGKNDNDEVQVGDIQQGQQDTGRGQRRPRGAAVGHRHRQADRRSPHR